MNTCCKQRAPLPVRKPKQTGMALRHAATRNVIIAETVAHNTPLPQLLVNFCCFC
jgi:hypothetical protein